MSEVHERPAGKSMCIEIYIYIYTKYIYIYIYKMHDGTWYMIYNLQLVGVSTLCPRTSLSDSENYQVPTTHISTWLILSKISHFSATTRLVHVCYYTLYIFHWLNWIKKSWIKYFTRVAIYTKAQALRETPQLRYSHPGTPSRSPGVQTFNHFFCLVQVRWNHLDASYYSNRICICLFIIVHWFMIKNITLCCKFGEENNICAELRQVCLWSMVGRSWKFCGISLGKTSRNESQPGSPSALLVVDEARRQSTKSYSVQKLQRVLDVCWFYANFVWVQVAFLFDAFCVHPKLWLTLFCIWTPVLRKVAMLVSHSSTGHSVVRYSFW